jgi:enoyl-[acyl-carrier protein] reductase I
MGLMSGKKGIIFGVSNKRGIGYAIANAIHKEGGDIAFTYANEMMKNRVTPIAEEMDAKLIMECNVTDESHIKSVFDRYHEIYGNIDFIVHAVAFANKDDLDGNFSNISKSGWDMALGTSAYSLIAISRHAKPLMNPNGAITALTYLGGERYVPNYNIMAIAKSALDSSVRYLAAEFGEINVRVNALSAGPVKTLAFKGIAGSDILLKISEMRAPLQRNVTLDEVGNSGLYLCSPLSTGVTGEIHHVDCGMHSVAINKQDAQILAHNATPD